MHAVKMYEFYVKMYGKIKKSLCASGKTSNSFYFCQILFINNHYLVHCQCAACFASIRNLFGVLSLCVHFRHSAFVA